VRLKIINGVTDPRSIRIIIVFEVNIPHSVRAMAKTSQEGEKVANRFAANNKIRDPNMGSFLPTMSATWPVRMFPANKPAI